MKCLGRRLSPPYEVKTTQLQIQKCRTRGEPIITKSQILPTRQTNSGFGLTALKAVMITIETTV